jgi:hypothetical protein
MKKTLVLLIALAFMGTGMAQKVKVAKGDPGVLKGETSVKVVFSYDDMGVGKFKKEQDYVDDKVKDYNKDEKGKGDQWAKAWVDDRSARYEPKFEELMNEHLDKSGIIISEKTEESKYTMMVNTDFTEPGYNAGVMKKPAYINLSINIVETADPSKVISTITVEKSPGSTFGYGDFDTGLRISESYAKAGKEVAQLLAKKYLK